MEFMGNNVDFLGIAPSNEEDMLRMIEVAGRTCYKSEEKIGPLTYHTFFKMILNRKHFSVIEHSNIVLRIRKDLWETFYPEMITWLHISKQCGYFELAEYDGYYYIASNLRAWFMFFVKLFQLMKGNLNSSPVLSFVLYSLLNHYPKIFKMFVDSIEDYVPIEVDENVPWFGSYMELVNEELQVEILIKSNLRMNLPVFIFRVLTNRGMCYDEQTKVLTKEGWKNFSLVTENDEFYTLNDEDRIEYLKPTQIVKYDYKGELDRYKSTQIDLLVTPNHNMWVKKYEGRDWEFIQSQDMNNKRYWFNKSCRPQKIESEEYFQIDRHIRTTNNRQIIYPSLKFKSKELFTLLGFWITDGNIYFTSNSGGNRISISQTKQPHRNYLLNLIESLGLDYSVSGPNIRINSQPLLHWVANNFLIENNTFRTFNYFIPRWIFTDLNYEEKKCFLRGVILGNGSPTTRGIGYQIYTSSYKFCEDVVELCLHLGIPANIRTVEPRDRFWTDGRISHCKETYVINIHSQKLHLFDMGRCGTKNKEYYEGKVYCAELPKYHRLFVMRNGKACWSGNTHELVRNRTHGFAQESTRYVNYYKKLGLRFFNDSNRFPEPNETFDENFILAAKEKMFNLYKDIEDTYNHLVQEVNGKRLMHQEFARNILPNSLMTEIVISGRLGADDEYSGYDLSSSLTHLIRQRTSSAAHPDIRPIGAAIFKYIDMIINKEKYVEVKEEEVEKDYLNNCVKDEK